MIGYRILVKGECKEMKRYSKDAKQNTCGYSKCSQPDEVLVDWNQAMIDRGLPRWANSPGFQIHPSCANLFATGLQHIGGHAIELSESEPEVVISEPEPVEPGELEEEEPTSKRRVRKPSRNKPEKVVEPKKRGRPVGWRKNRDK